MSLLKFNKLFRNQNQKGFSLVELMIALTILAFFAVGIVAAFSGAFQAMADSKYRTVATNLAQQKLEEVKNVKGEDYPFFRTYTYPPDEEPNSGMNYNIQVVAHKFEKDEDNKENYAKVTSTVEWYNRKGDRKFVQLVTHVYDLRVDKEEIPQDIGKMELNAYPDEMICCLENQISTITAEVFDEENKRYAVTGTPVLFSVDEGGVLSDEIALTDTIGRATTELSIIDGYSTAKVTAVCGPISRDVTVTCEPVPDEVILSSDPSIISPGNRSKITAVVQDSCGQSVIDRIGEMEVTFSIEGDKAEDIYFDGEPGHTQTKVVPTTNGIATIYLYMGTSGKKATVRGTVTPKKDDLFNEFSNTTTVICTDYNITVDPKNATIFPDGSVKITATLKKNDSPEANRNITFSASAGNFLNSSATTDSNGQAWVTLSGLTGGSTASVTASFTDPDWQDITISDTSIIKCQQYILTIKAVPDTITPNGSSVITVELTDYLNNPIGYHLVDFSTTLGTLSQKFEHTNNYGIATTTLSGLKSGDKAEITATFGETDVISETVSVTCINYVLDLVANPNKIARNGTSTITATLKDYLGGLQTGKKVTFTTNVGLFTNGRNEIEVNTGTSGSNRGIATATLTINTSGTTATITATSEGAVATTTVTCANTYIALATPSNISLSNGRRDISFDLRLYGGPLIVNKVKAEWTTDSSNNPTGYSQMWIRSQSPLTGTQTEIYNRNANNNGSTETLNRNNPYTIPKDATFRIHMRFNSAINVSRNLVFTFNPEDPNADNYSIEFNIP